MTAAYRILITGSRTWTDEQAVWEALAEAAYDVPADREVTWLAAHRPEQKTA